MINFVVINYLYLKRPGFFYFILFIFLLIVGSINATHIVGGVIYYEHLGGNKYKLIFEVYRDCSPAVVVGYDGTPSNNPNQQLPPFYFSVFRGNIDNNIAASLPPFFTNALQLQGTALKINPVIVNPCLKVDKNTCVERGFYETIIDLPSNTEGYTIQHMRCCRNDGILNIRNASSLFDTSKLINE